MNEQQIRTLMKNGKYKQITDSPEARQIWRELYQLPTFEADERRQTMEWECERNTGAFKARMEGGRPLPWHFMVPVPKPSDEVLNLFRSSPSRQLWLQKMYDFVFPKDKATEKATREQAEFNAESGPALRWARPHHRVGVRIKTQSPLHFCTRFIAHRRPHEPSRDGQAKADSVIAPISKIVYRCTSTMQRITSFKISER